MAQYCHWLVFGKRPWWDSATPEADQHMSRWDSATLEDDCMLSRSSDDASESIGASAAGAAFWECRFSTSRHRSTIKRDHASVELEVLSELRSQGEGIVDFGDDRIRGLECQVEGGVMVFNINPAWQASRQTPSPIVMNDQARSCVGGARGFRWIQELR